jgi:hypothetical protein
MMMNETITGGCLCGAVRFACSGKPGPAVYCHCADCRKGSGSAFHVGVPFSAKSFEIVSGTPKGFTKRADSGRELTRYFCPDCGSPLYITSASRPEWIFAKAGALDDPERVKPTSQIWTRSSVAWSTIEKGLPSFEKGRN